MSKKNDLRVVMLDYADMTLGDYDNPGENEQVAYFINYCLDKRTTIKLSLSINDDDNDDVFYYCNGIESFKQLAEYGMVEFIVTYCWSFF